MNGVVHQKDLGPTMIPRVAMLSSRAGRALVLLAVSLLLYPHGLHEAIKDAPESGLARLRADVLAGRGGADALFALAELPAHSIVAVNGNGPIETGDDGVVKYESAHIDGVESELVVRWDHSVQGQPQAIEEVRRILTLHAGTR